MDPNSLEATSPGKKPTKQNHKETIKTKMQSFTLGSNYCEATDKSKTQSNLLLCGLCFFSVAISMYSTYRGNLLEGKVFEMENRFVVLQRSVSEPSEALLVRLRKEVEGKLQHRMTREAVSTGRRLLAAELESEQPRSGLVSLLRKIRDVPDCNCPAGNMTHTSK